VGGSVEEAKKVEFGWGQAGNKVWPAADWLGLLINVTLAYCAFRRLKSLDVVTVLLSEDKVIIPKLPWAGKYEKAKPPDQLGTISGPNNA
jgi:hypothetical protein